MTSFFHFDHRGEERDEHLARDAGMTDEEFGEVTGENESVADALGPVHPSD